MPVTPGATTGSTAPPRRLWALIAVLAGLAILVLRDQIAPETPAAPAAPASVKARTPPPRTDVAPRAEAATRARPDRSAPASREAPEPLEALIDRGGLYPIREASAPGRDLFAGVNWAPPSAPVVAASAAAPAAPALPYVYLGKRLDDGRWTLFLGRGEQVVLAREGDILDQTYRIDEVAPPNVRFIYLPLKQAQQLAVGDPL